MNSEYEKKYQEMFFSEKQKKFEEDKQAQIK